MVIVNDPGLLWCVLLCCFDWLLSLNWRTGKKVLQLSFHLVVRLEQSRVWNHFISHHKSPGSFMITMFRHYILSAIWKYKHEVFNIQKAYDTQDRTTLKENTEPTQIHRYLTDQLALWKTPPGPQNVAFKPEQPKVQNKRNATDNRAVKNSRKTEQRLIQQREYSDEPLFCKAVTHLDERQPYHC